MRENDSCFKNGPRLRDNRHLDPRPNAGIEPNDTLVSGGRREQQILQVGTENPDRLFLRFVTKPREETLANHASAARPLFVSPKKSAIFT